MTEKNKHSEEHPEESGLDLFRPTRADEEKGITGITLEHEIVSVATLRARKRRRHAIMLSAISLFVAALVIISAAFITRYDPFKTRDYSGGGNGTTVTFTIRSGQSTAQVANELEAAGVIADADKFVEVYSKESNGKYLQPGTYELQQHMSSSSAINTIIEANSNVLYLAIPQGKRVTETIDLIVSGSDGAFTRKQVEEAVQNYTQYGVPSNFPSIEGWLHPGEYRFPKDTDIKKVIQTMVDKTKADLKEAGVSGDQKAFEVLTIASIVELEAQPKDYVAVAGIIENRLNNPDGETSGLIQSDATVTYGLGVRSYHLTEEQKADKNNKYNTYANKGLPKGPIGSPQLASIKAAAAPEKNPYYYWVTVDLDSGETKYSRTYAEHQRYVEEYNQWCSKHPGRCN